MTNTTTISAGAIEQLLQQVPDPEIPVLSIIDLGIVRDIQIEGDGITVYITPTYTGCPAMDMIALSIVQLLQQHQYKKVQVKQLLTPAWTTAWITEAGKQKLLKYGIAPPDKRFSIPQDGVSCPQCGSNNTTLVSAFGSTACKALYTCKDCLEPFDYFKCH
ncbi:MAG TPA: phenylacetate-CoA oxygenase subunit PaaJ [Ferruginibacter sp.]|nr:phenylacetate-CoA oxygenase subunit PaaJ [Ferruginibacter sp.]HMP20654.1 phenylacetate-CoA oxygenase subunit PaaJ [Ferruginibacter sp.]